MKQDFAPTFPVPLSPLIARSAARAPSRWCLMARSSLPRWANLPEYDSGVVFGKGEADPDVEEDAGCLLHLYGGASHPVERRAMNLYEAEIALLNEGARERTGLKVGLRKFELKERQMLLNGKRIVFKGCQPPRVESLHRPHRQPGRDAVDVKNLKAHNVNAVRTSHYPNDPYFPSLCGMNTACMSSGRPI